jgi:hypothetical protein
MKKVNPKPPGEELEPRLPTDLRKALAASSTAKAQWRDLTPIARSDFISWMDSAKQPETHRRRIEKACLMLAAGKRRPRCSVCLHSCPYSFGILDVRRRILRHHWRCDMARCILSVWIWGGYPKSGRAIHRAEDMVGDLCATFKVIRPIHAV